MRKQITLSPFSLHFLAVMFFVTAISGGANSYDISPDTIMLVHAKVISVESKGVYGRIGQVEITHVYCGPSNLRRRTFDAYSTTGQDSTGVAIMPALESGESGIWCLRQDNGTLIPVFSQYGTGWPARDKFYERYADAKALAEAIEHVANELPEKRTSLLKISTLDRTPEVSTWAINALAKPEFPDNLAFLRQLAENSQLGLNGQVELDRILSDLDSRVWINSALRRSMLQKWLLGAPGKYEAFKALTRLIALIQPEEPDNQTILSILKTGAENDALPIDCRRWAVHQIGTAAKKAPNIAGEVFKNLIEQIKSSGNAEIQLAAAYAIKDSISLDAEHAAALRKIRGPLTDKRLTEVLDNVLDRTPKQ
jgi:hypothetical protein